MQPDATPFPDLPTDQSDPDVVIVPPAQLVAKFGMPTRRPSIGDKTTGEYIFLGYGGRFILDDGWAELRHGEPTDVFAVSDWRATSLYAEGLPAPLEFWSGPVPQEFHLGGYSGPRQRHDFVRWLLGQTEDR